MNRKLVNGLLLLSIATVGCGTFTSCKDTDENFKNEVILSQEDLAKKLIEYIDAHQCDCPADAAELLGYLRSFLADPQADGKVNQAVLQLINAQLTTQFGDDYTTWMNKTNLSNLVHSTDKAWTDMVEAAEKIGELNSAIETLKDEDIAAALARANEAYTEALSAMNAIGDINDWYGSDTGFKQDVLDIINDALTPLKKELATLQPQIDAIRNQLAKLITGILVQQTYNPMFGSINLPFGIQSNVVANYYGMSDHALKFPFNVGEDNYEFNGDNSILAKNAGIAAAAAALTPKNGFASIQSNVAYVEDDNDSNLGTVYLTINPNNIDFTGIKTLTLVNSKDEEAPVELVTEKDDNTVLNFGYTRANNGFYATKVNVTAENAPKLALRIESGLKSAMKDALTERNISDFAQLGKVVYNQMSNVCPAYGVKASWEAEEVTPVKDAEGNVTGTTTETKEYAVYSKYDMAVATVHPLGYQFLYGEGINKELPTFGHLTDKLHEFFNDIKKDVTFNLNLGIDVNKYKINLDLSKVTFNLNFDKLTVNIPQLPVYNHNHYKYTVTASGEVVYEKDANGNLVVADGHKDNDDCVIGTTGTSTIELTYTDGVVSGNEGALNGLINAINSAIEEMMKDESNPNSFASIIKTEVTGKMNDLIADINNQLEGINGQINGQVSDILNKIENQLAGKFDGAQKLIDKYNELANKINRVLKNPNNYLQVMMAYQTKNSGLGKMSNNFNDPTVFDQAGGNTIEVFATSFTADLVAPSYKKYVAVTRAWEGNVEKPAEAAAVNSASEYLNYVAPGRQQIFGLTGLKSGIKYEIIYTSLDYRGRTSTNAYYLLVK